jgi:hypothetical protein
MKLLTNCSFPPALDEKTLLLYLDGEAGSETLSHLENCLHCRQQAQALDRFQKRLTSRLFRVECPSPMVLAEAKHGMLSDSKKLVVEQHIRQCPHCTGEAAQLDFFWQELDLPTKNTTVETVKALLIGGEAASTPGEMGFSSLAPALRGDAKEMMVFEAEGLVITLQIVSSSDGQVSIQGQLASDNQDKWTGALVTIVQQDMPDRSTSLDEFGAFQFEQIRPGLVQFRIAAATRIEVQIQDVNISM